MNKIKDLLSRIDTLEPIFRAPADDAKEQKRRDVLLRYVVISLSGSALSTSKEVQGHRSGTEEVVQGAGAAAIC